MYRQKIVALALLGVLAACGSSGDDDVAPADTAPIEAAAPTSTAAAETTIAATTTTAAATTTTAAPRPSLRNVRYCEVLLLGKEGADFIAHVWNSMGHGDCPQADWEALDATAIAAERGVPIALLNGPRYWTLDSIDATMQLEAPVSSFGAIDMFEAATLNLGPEPPNQTPYTERGVVRETVFRFDAGSEVYELTGPDGSVYVMQSYSLMLDPSQRIETMADLGSRLALPAGWSFSSRVLDEELELLSTDGIATVVQDERQNTYQRDDARRG